MRTQFAPIVSAALLCTAIPLCSAAPKAAAPAGLPNYGIVDPGLYRGAAPTEAGLQTLKKMGIETVIDLRISPKLVKKEAVDVQQLGMKFVNLPMGSEPATSKQQQTFLQIVSEGKQHPVYVHCQHGADRTGEMIGLYRRVDDHWTYPQAYAEMRHYGFKPYYTQLAAVVKKADPTK